MKIEIKNTDEIECVKELTSEIINGVKILNNELELYHKYVKLVDDHYKSCIIKDPGDIETYKQMRDEKKESEKKRIKLIYYQCKDLIDMFRSLMSRKKPFIKLIEQCETDNIKFTFEFYKEKKYSKDGKKMRMKCNF